MDTNKKYNIIFLDYDGVISIPSDNFYENVANPDAIKYLNQLCLDFDFDLVISSSWRKYHNYKDLFYSFGIDKRIKIIGCTEINDKNRVEQIKDYIRDHKNEIDKFLILDDAYFPGELGKHHVQTPYNMGFTKNKYIEALDKIQQI